MNNLLSFIINNKIIFSAIFFGIIYNIYKNIFYSSLTFFIIHFILTYLEKNLSIEHFYMSTTDRNFFCKALEKVSKKCEKHINKKNCSKGNKCNECEKFSYHLEKTRKLLNSILSKKF